MAEGKTFMDQVEYSFDIFKKEHLRYSWLSGRYTDSELREKFWKDYVSFCHLHGMKHEQSGKDGAA